MDSVIEFYSPVQHMGKDGYFTHKYFSVSPDCLVLQDSFQFKFVFTSLTSSNLLSRTNSGVRASKHVLLFSSSHLVFFQQRLSLYERSFDLCALLGSLYNWNSQESRTDGQLTNYVTVLPWTINTLGSSAVHYHTVWPHNQAVQWEIQSNPDACACT